MKKQISLIFLLLPVFLFIFLVKVPPVSALTQEDCAKFSSTSFLPSSECMAVPCSNAYKWVLIQPGTGGAPVVDATRFGANNACGGANATAADAVCPQNTSDLSNVDATTSNQCYGFTEGNRCIQIQHIEGQTCPGYINPGDTGPCSIGDQTPDLGSACAACLSSKTSPTDVPGVISNIKNMDPTNFNGCSNQKILNKWCNGFGATATSQCSTLKSGVCSASCGGGGGTPGSVACNNKTSFTPTELGINDPRICNRLHEYVLVAPVSQGGGAATCSQYNTCTKKDHSDCPQNTSQPNLITEDGSNWCYGFADGARCLQLRYKGQPGDPSCVEEEDGGPGTQCINPIGRQNPDLGARCSACIASGRSGLTAAIKSNNPNLFVGCTDKELINYWCNGGMGADGQTQCSSDKSGVCNADCGGGGGGSCSANVEEARRQLIQAGGSFQNSSCDAVTNAVCSNCAVFVPPNAIRTALCPANSCGGSASYTTHYRIAEDSIDLNSAEWEVYTGASMPRDYTFKDQTPGVKTIFVQFKDSNGGISCGDNKSDCSVQVRVLGDPPTVTSCSLSFEGNNTICVLNLKGANFGSTKGTVKNEDTPLETRAWKDDSVQAVWPNAPVGQNLSVSLTNLDGLSSDVVCSSASPLALGAKVFCRAPSGHQTSNVDLTLAPVASQSGAVIKQKVQIDKDGVVQGLNQKLEAGRQYLLSLKAPKGLRRTLPFAAEEGTTSLPNFILPIGDISPVDGGDGVINSSDKSELNRQWSIARDVTGRTGDFNQDGRVNSVDWACMRYDFGKTNDKEASLGAR